MAFVRVNRDKRGYEQIYLMRGAGQRGKGGAPRVLYVFRTPPGIKVGREPFDETVRRSLEEQNPGVHFDWPKLSVILPPAPDVEYWRERRRAEKAAKHAQRQEQRQDAVARDADSSTAAQELEPDDDLTPDDEEVSGEMDLETVGGETEPAEALAAPAALTPSESHAPEARRRRRRRRGGRGRKRQPPSEGLAQVPADTPNIPGDSSKER